MSSKDEACWDTLDAAILASAKVPEVIFDAARFGTSAASKVIFALSIIPFVFVPSKLAISLALVI